MKLNRLYIPCIYIDTEVSATQLTAIGIRLSEMITLSMMYAYRVLSIEVPGDM
jgi:hypothetical protein